MLIILSGLFLIHTLCPALSTSARAAYCKAKSLCWQHWCDMMWLPGPSAALGEINPDSNITPVPSYCTDILEGMSETLWEQNEHLMPLNTSVPNKSSPSADKKTPLMFPCHCPCLKLSTVWRVNSVLPKLLCLLQLSAKYCPQWYLLPHVFIVDIILPSDSKLLTVPGGFFLWWGRWNSSLRIIFVLLWQCCL